jgi:phenol/toluene 2-monooxygenase (NADH) P3/A3
MTRGLDWETTYQPMERGLPVPDQYEGIKIHDWDKWVDPFRLTMDAYWKYQAEKERKLYAVIDAFNQNNGHLGVTDARYINTLKLFLTGREPAGVHGQPRLLPRGPPDARRRRRAWPARCSRSTSTVTSRRRSTRCRTTTSTTTASTSSHMIERVWYLSRAASFFDDAYHRRPVRVHGRHRLLVRVRADQPAVRAVHLRRRLQRRHGRR